jgi:hypothetical protein
MGHLFLGCPFSMPDDSIVKPVSPGAQVAPPLAAPAVASLTAQAVDIQVDLADPVDLQTSPVGPQPVQEVQLGEDLNIYDLEGVETVPVPHKELAAMWVAKAIVLIFGISMGLLILLGFTMFFWLRWAPDKVTVITSNAIVPYVEKVGTFAATVFGPLLAFVLGYYFGQKAGA